MDGVCFKETKMISEMLITKLRPLFTKETEAIYMSPKAKRRIMFVFCL